MPGTHRRPRVDLALLAPLPSTKHLREISLAVTAVQIRQPCLLQVWQPRIAPALLAIMAPTEARAPSAQRGLGVLVGYRTLVHQGHHPVSGAQH